MELVNDCGEAQWASKSPGTRSVHQRGRGSSQNNQDPVELKAPLGPWTKKLTRLVGPNLVQSNCGSWELENVILN